MTDCILSCFSNILYCKAYVSWKPSESVASLLLTQNVYVVVSTTAFPTGELVGAIRVNARSKHLAFTLLLLLHRVVCLQSLLLFWPVLMLQVHQQMVESLQLDNWMATVYFM